MPGGSWSTARTWADASTFWDTRTTTALPTLPVSMHWIEAVQGLKIFIRQGDFQQPLGQLPCQGVGGNAAARSSRTDQQTEGPKKSRSFLRSPQLRMLWILSHFRRPGDAAKVKLQALRVWDPCSSHRWVSTIAKFCSCTTSKISHHSTKVGKVTSES